MIRMTDYPICGAYFRPWSPGDANHVKLPYFNDSPSEKDSPVLDLSKKRNPTSCKTQSSVNKKSTKSVSKESPISKQRTSMESSMHTPSSPSSHSILHGSSHNNNNHNAFSFPNPFLLQQIQAYYNFQLMRGIPALHATHGLNEELLKWQKHAVPCVTPSDVFNTNIKARSSRAGVNPGTLNIDTVTDPAFIQRRGILNIPSPSFSHNSHSSLTDESWEAKYPLPSAKDGEPLDLLPKSLYMNKAHGGHLCIFCGKLYSRKYGLKIHLRTHTGYKPLKCKVCQRPFGDPSNLNKHIRLHAEGDTPYRCDQCGKVLVRRRDLERHIRSRHPNEAEKMIQSDSPISSDEGMNSSFEAGSIEELELDVVGLHQ